MKQNNYAMIRSTRLQDWLEINGIDPVYIWGTAAYYQRPPRFLDLLELYDIRFNYFHNRWER